jgi:hypothetical protein
MPPKITNVVRAEQNIVNNDPQNIKNVNTKRKFINLHPSMLNALDQKISLITKGVFESLAEMNEKEQKLLPKLYDLQTLLKTSSEIKFEDLEKIEHKEIVENLKEEGIEVISTNSNGEKFIKKSKIDFEIQKINTASKQILQKAESDLSLKKMLEQLGYNLKDLDGGVRTMINNQKSS